MKLKTWVHGERGRLTALAAALGVRPPVVSAWLSGRKPVPARRAPAVESFTAAAVTRRDLRPDDWHLIWPELADSDNSEPNPADARTSQAQPATESEAHEASA